MSLLARYLLLLVLFAIFLHGNVTYLAVYALVVVYVAFRSMVNAALRRLTVTRRGSRLRLFPDQTMTLGLTVENPSRFPLPWLIVEERASADLGDAPTRRFALSLPPKGKEEVEYRIRAKRRGIYRLGPVTAEGGDPFGLEAFKVMAADPVEVVVYPRVHTLETLGIPSNALSGPFRAPKRYLSDPAQVAGVRDYVAGDPISHVHWKATAHAAAVKVKTFEPLKYLDIAVILDLERDRYQPWNATIMSELAIEVGASLAVAAHRGRQAFGCLAVGRVDGVGASAENHWTGIRKGDRHLDQLLEMLARVRMANGSSRLGDVILRSKKLLRRETTVVVVTPSIDFGANHALARLVGDGYRAMVVEMRTEPGRCPPPRGVRYVRIAGAGEIKRLGAVTPAFG